MGVMWTTRNATSSSVARAGLSPTSLTLTFPGSAALFAPAGNVPQYIHRANFTGLNPGTRYYYQVGDGGAVNVSSVLTFTTAVPFNSASSGAGPGPYGNGTRTYPVAAIYGDMGIDVNAHRTLPLLYQVR